MNLYVRYFNEEALVRTAEEVISFLLEINIPDFPVNAALQADLKSFADSPSPFPKRYKVNPRAYFIVIKTTAKTLEEFKENKRERQEEYESSAEGAPRLNSKPYPFVDIRRGWYEGTILFRRVVPIGSTGKSHYVDTRFVAQLKADSIQHCYDRIIEHLRNRQDVDPRSQFPSIKGKNFSCTFIGETRNGDAAPSENDVAPSESDAKQEESLSSVV